MSPYSAMPASMSSPIARAKSISKVKEVSVFTIFRCFASITITQSATKVDRFSFCYDYFLHI